MKFERQPAVAFNWGYWLYIKRWNSCFSYLEKLFNIS